jgi:hypothetical protein
LVVLLDFLPETFLIVDQVDLVVEYILADQLVFLLDLLELLFVEVPVTAWDKLVEVGVESVDRWLQVPDPFEEIHVLFLQMRFLLLLPEHLDRRFRFSEGRGQTRYPPLEALQRLQLPLIDELHRILVPLVFFLLALLEENVFDDGAAVQRDGLHNKIIEIINRLSKSWGGDGVDGGKHAVAVGGGLGPNPTASDVVVVEVAPKVVLSALGERPVPGLLDRDSGAVHVVHVVPVGEGGHLGVRSEGILAHLGPCDVRVDLQAAHGVSESDYAAGPALVEAPVGVAEGLEDGVVLVKGSVELLGVEDAGDWQNFSAGGVTLLRVAPIAGHPPDVAVLLFRPHGGREGESLLRRKALLVVRVEFRRAQAHRQE